MPWEIALGALLVFLSVHVEAYRAMAGWAEEARSQEDRKAGELP